MAPKKVVSKTTAAAAKVSTPVQKTSATDVEKSKSVDAPTSGVKKLTASKTVSTKASLSLKTTLKANPATKTAKTTLKPAAKVAAAASPQTSTPATSIASVNKPKILANTKTVTKLKTTPATTKTQPEVKPPQSVANKSSVQAKVASPVKSVAEDIKGPAEPSVKESLKEPSNVTEEKPNLEKKSIETAGSTISPKTSTVATIKRPTETEEEGEDGVVKKMKTISTIVLTKSKQLTDEERLALRAEKFKTNLMEGTKLELRKARFGNSNSGSSTTASKPSSTPSTNDDEIKRKRQERFSASIVPPPNSTIDEKLAQRRAKFSQPIL